jgi:L-iditol 2-dehydrogenase
MKAIVKLSNEAGDVALIDKPEPVRANPGHVILEVLAAGVCGTDLSIAKGLYKTFPNVTIGHELTGRVGILGEGVDATWLGKRVVPETFFGTCGTCVFCRSGRENLCYDRKSIGTHVDGAFAGWLEIPAKNLHEVPETLSNEAGSMGEPVACVVNSLFEIDGHPRIGPGDKVLVVGPGPIGLIAAQVARACGGEVTLQGAPGDAVRLALAGKLGFAVLTAGAGEFPVDCFDAAVECSGNRHGVADAFRSLRKGGRLMQMGLVGGEIPLAYDTICIKELTVTSGFAANHRSWLRAIPLMASGRIDLESLVTATSPLDTWHEILVEQRSRDGVKHIFKP